MSNEYNVYLKDHCDNVSVAFHWIMAVIPLKDILSILPDVVFDTLKEDIENHDMSKYSLDEYDAYDNYFYGEQTSEVLEQFNYAWLHHIHNNPHHWQHWVLIQDKGGFNKDPDKIIALDMPDNDILHMICDWWSFSWKNYWESDNPKDLKKVFNWYDAKLNTIILSENTRHKVDAFLWLLMTYIHKEFKI